MPIRSYEEVQDMKKKLYQKILDGGYATEDYGGDMREVLGSIKKEIMHTADHQYGIEERKCLDIDDLISFLTGKAKFPERYKRKKLTDKDKKEIIENFNKNQTWIPVGDNVFVGEWERDDSPHSATFVLAWDEKTVMYTCYVRDGIAGQGYVDFKGYSSLK